VQNFVNWAGGQVAYVQVRSISPTGPSGGRAGFAGGTDFFTGGRAMVGETGPEIVDLPRGSRIYPHGQKPPDSGGGPTHNITVNVNNAVVGGHDQIARTVVSALATYYRNGGARP
jgi:hypothetical protein